MLDAEELSNIMFFFTMFGPDLPRILRSPDRLKEIHRDPRGKIWVEKGESLGILRVSGDEITVDWDGLRELKKRIIEVLEECLK